MGLWDVLFLLNPAGVASAEVSRAIIGGEVPAGWGNPIRKEPKTKE